MINIRDKKFLKAFGKHLKKMREDKGFSQSYLANIAGVERSQIIRMENGELNTTISTLKVLADALEVDKKELMDF